MRKQSILSVILSAVLFLQILTINTAVNNTDVKADNNDSRMKGVWVSTVANLDYPTKATTDSQVLKSEADEIIKNCKELGFNAIFLQVRPSSDAIYKSEIFPWSQYLTGSQGVAPDNGFDPLKYWADKCHDSGIELHGWINPYRATRNGAGLDSLANMNPAKQHPEYMVKYSDGNYYYDPAIPEVRDLLTKGVMEIINNYDVDGIHMDDYFYPGQSFDDSQSYEKYGNGQDKDDWRRENVNILIKQIHDSIKASGRNVEFGISPSGVWANKENNPLGSETRGSESYYKLYADTRKWAVEEWIDYICPQIYWEIGHTTADYKTLAYWWADTLADSNTKLYIGLADYKCDGAGSSSVWYNGNAILEQLKLNKASIPKISGEVHFRYQLIVDNPSLSSIIKNENTGSSDNLTVSEAQTQQTAAVTEASAEVITEAAVPEINYGSAASEFDVNSVVNTDPNKILVYIDGKSIEFDQEPVIKNSRTLVPFRKIFEALGAEVEWHKDTEQVIGRLEDREVSLVIGESIMLVNRSQSIILDSPPVIIGSRTMVPLRAISEALGMEVSWNDSNRVVTINSK